MKPLIQLKKATPLLLITLACFGLSPTSRAVSPPPDGGYPIQNTAEGDFALNALTSGIDNTAIGYQALFNNTTGNINTANGALALCSNTTGNFNTAIGDDALAGNTNGIFNTANGAYALLNNNGSDNTLLPLEKRIEAFQDFLSCKLSACQLGQSDGSASCLKCVFAGEGLWLKGSMALLLPQPSLSPSEQAA